MGGAPSSTASVGQLLPLGASKTGWGRTAIALRGGRVGGGGAWPLPASLLRCVLASRFGPLRAAAESSTAIDARWLAAPHSAGCRWPMFLGWEALASHCLPCVETLPPPSYFGTLDATRAHARCANNSLSLMISFLLLHPCLGEYVDRSPAHCLWAYRRCRASATRLARSPPHPASPATDLVIAADPLPQGARFKLPLPLPPPLLPAHPAFVPPHAQAPSNATTSTTKGRVPRAKRCVRSRPVHRRVRWGGGGRGVGGGQRAPPVTPQSLSQTQTTRR